MSEADSQTFASAPSVPRGFPLHNVWPPFGGGPPGQRPQPSRARQVLVDRCTGLGAGLNASGGRSEMLYITGESSVDVLRQQLTDAMTAAPTGAAFLTLNSDIGALSVALAGALGRPDLRIGTFDFGSPLVPLLKNGTLEFSLHQQNYAQVPWPEGCGGGRAPPGGPHRGNGREGGGGHPSDVLEWPYAVGEGGVTPPPPPRSSPSNV